MIEVIGRPGENEHEVARPVPQWFKDKLRQFDSKLLVMWNKRKERWVIEECMEHLSGQTEHTHLCRRDPFFLLANPDGSAIDLEDSRIFTHWLLKFNIEKRFGGAEGLVAKMNEIDAANEEKERRDARRAIEDAKKDNKKQLEEAITLIDRHDIWRPHS